MADIDYLAKRAGFLSTADAMRQAGIRATKLSELTRQELATLEHGLQNGTLFNASRH
jgi:hypothetical protein